MLRVRQLGVAALVLLCSVVCPSRAQTLSVLAASAPLNDPQGMAIDSAGNIYVSNGALAGGYGGSVVKIAPNGTATTIFSDWVGPMIGATLDGVAVDSAGNVYVADTANSRIVKITPTGAAGTFADATAGISQPNGLLLDPGGNLYISSTAANTILKATPGGTVTTFIGAQGGLSAPDGMAMDAAGNLYVANTYYSLFPGAAQNTVSKVTPGGAISTYAQGFTNPSSLAFDRNGNLFVGGYVFEAGYIDEVKPNGTVVSFDSTHLGRNNGMVFNAQGNLLVDDGLANSLFSFTPADALKVTFDGLLAAPRHAAQDAAGNLYVSNSDDNSIVKISPSGTVSRVAGGPGAMVWGPEGLAVDAGGTLYVADSYNRVIDKVAPTGEVTTFVGAAAGIVSPADLAFGPDGNLYVSDYRGEAIYRVTSSGAVSTFVGSGAGLSFPDDLAFDAAGNLYVSGLDGAVRKITPAGAVSIFISTQTNELVQFPQGLAFDSSGNLFVATLGTVKIVEATPDGTVTPAVSGAPGLLGPQLTAPEGLVFNGAGQLIVLDSTSNALVRVSFQPSPLAAAILPGARSVALGSSATVFATMLNLAGTTLGPCDVSMPAGYEGPIAFTYQSTDPQTNLPIGTAGQPVTLAANGSQTFLLTFQSNYGYNGITLTPSFNCQNVAPAPVVIGVDTVDLAFTTNPGPDVIALAATASNDGTLHVVNGAGAFAVATDNAGLTGDLTMTADTGAASLPLALSLCQTSADGQCMTAPAASLPLSFAAGATPTFSIFVGSDGAIPFAPSTSRIFVRFKDSSGASHGSTSVAVTTN